MKKIITGSRSRISFLWAAALCFAALNTAAQSKQTGSNLVRTMHQRYYKGPCASYTFSQRNLHYRNDSIVKRSEWYEAIEFPDKFRIDFGDKTDKNFVIFKNDSVFNYKKGGLLKARPDSNLLLLLLGGMYYRRIEDVLARIKNEKIDLSVLSHQKWNSKDVFVIGAKENDLAVNQVWIDQKTLVVLRIIEARGEKDRMDIRFETHQEWCKGFIETKVSFRRNGQLEKIEEYYDIRESKGFPY